MVSSLLGGLATCDRLNPQLDWHLAVSVVDSRNMYGSLACQTFSRDCGIAWMNIPVLTEHMLQLGEKQDQNKQKEQLTEVPGPLTKTKETNVLGLLACESQESRN